MPFWNIFWLIVPAVTLLALAIVFFILTAPNRRTVHHDLEKSQRTVPRR